MSGITDSIGDVGSHSVALGLSGKYSADAAQEGAAAQVAAGKEALKLLRGDLDPFRQLGVNQIDSVSALASDRDAQNALLASDPNFQQFSDLSTDSQAQMDFLSNNPLFDSLREQASKDTFANQAARGKLSGSGTEELLQNRFLQMGNDLINQQIQRTGGAISTGNDLVNQQLNRQLPLLNMGQASAAQTGAGSADLLTGMGNATAAGGIAAANAQSQGAANVAGAGMGLMSLMALSDERLKTDVVKVGEHEGVPIYEWSWNDTAKAVGKSGKGRGHIAQELQKTHPHLVNLDEKSGFLYVDYSTDETTEAAEWL